MLLSLVVPGAVHCEEMEFVLNATRHAPLFHSTDKVISKVVNTRVEAVKSIARIDASSTGELSPSPVSAFKFEM